jgi:acetoacetate decarboxylase
VAALVPRPLVPHPDGEVVLIAGAMHVPGLVSFHEAILGVPASLGGRAGVFCVLTYVDEDVPVAGGREIYGWPKKLARFRMQETEEAVAVDVERGGAAIMRASMTFDAAAVAEDAVRHRVWFNVKIVPSVARGAAPEVMQLTVCDFAGLRTGALRAGSLRVELGCTVADPLAELLPRLQPVSAAYGLVDFEIGHGAVLHDYLHDGRPDRP